MLVSLYQRKYRETQALRDFRTVHDFTNLTLRTTLINIPFTLVQLGFGTDYPYHQFQNL